eukprot:scaffold93180_cov65-Phaeocystis_antarctica.AAC.3
MKGQQHAARQVAQSWKQSQIPELHRSFTGSNCPCTCIPPTTSGCCCIPFCTTTGGAPNGLAAGVAACAFVCDIPSQRRVGSVNETGGYKRGICIKPPYRSQSVVQSVSHQSAGVPLA